MTITTAPQPPPRTRALPSIRIRRLARRARGVIMSLAVALGAALLPLPAPPASADAILATIPVGADVDRIVFSPDGALAYATLPQDDAIAVIDLASRTVLQRIPVGAWPNDIALTPDGTTIVVTIRDAQRVLFVDIGTATVTPLGIGAYPGELAVSPDGATAYVGYNALPRVDIVDVAARTVVGSIPTPAPPG